jgi:hypothetical protein
MSISTTALSRAAAVSGAAGGLLFLAVQIGHPVADAAYTTTAEFVIRQSAKIAFTVLSLVGVTGVYLRQVRESGVLGLIGYVLLGAAFLTMMSIEVLVMVVLPPLAHSATGYVSDVIAVALQGSAAGDIGLFPALNTAAGLLLIAGGVVFGIASFRARVLLRWPAALLAVGVVATLAIRVLPQVNERLFAVPIGVALAGFGVALWLKERTPAARPAAVVAPSVKPAGVE